ncbi:hypothetical protein ABT278_18535 [Streptomyces sp. NPDC001228]|uniref:hypothetical protein n=1 Tax=Streptomyces sp. NPDC001228 TaxID=3154381 RepID=UPI00331B6F2F
MKKIALAGAALALTAASASLAAPAASAAPAGHASSGHRIPFTAATVTAADDGSYHLVWRAPGVRSVTIRAAGHVVARGGATGDVTVKGAARRRPAVVRLRARARRLAAPRRPADQAGRHDQLPRRGRVPHQ